MQIVQCGRRRFTSVNARQNARRGIILGTYSPAQIDSAAMLVDDVGHLIGLPKSLTTGARVARVAKAIGFQFPRPCGPTNRLILLSDHIRLKHLTVPIELLRAVVSEDHQHMLLERLKAAEVDAAA